MVRIASPGAILIYAYNVRDQLVTETSQPAGRTSAWTVSRGYDGVENSTKFTCPGGSACHYVRDALNRITAVRDATRQNLVSYSHDSLSRMARAERQSGARSTASFDEVSRPLVVAHRQSATATSSLLSLSHARDTVGQITSLTDDLGVASYSYGKTSRTTRAAVPATAPYPDQTFAYGAAGNRSSVAATPQTAPATTPPPPPTPSPSPPTGGAAGTAGAGADETETSADSLAAPPSPAPTAPSTPSPAPAAPAATTTAYTANNLNQYTRVGAATPTYDKNGNMTSDGTNTYRWDAENRLTGATVPGAAGAAATTASYSYDAHHRRVKKTVGTTTTYFLWCGDTLLAEYSGSGTLQRRYLYAEGFAPVQVHDIAGTGTAVYDVHTDHLDTPRLLTNSTGAAVWTSHHRAFGKAHIATDPDGDATHVAFSFRFPGQYEDAEIGLHYNRYRYYDPGTGRYLSPDPIGQAGGVNIYPYVLNDPVNWFDLYGLYIQINGPPSYQSAVSGDLARIKAVDPDLKKMIEDLESSSNEHIIAAPPPGKFNSNRTTGERPNASNGIGTSSVTCYDPTATRTASGNKRDPAVGLTHELQHASDKDRGILDRTINPATTTRRSEERAMDAENKMRRVTGDPPRLKY